MAEQKARYLEDGTPILPPFQPGSLQDLENAPVWGDTTFMYIGECPEDVKGIVQYTTKLTKKVPTPEGTIKKPYGVVHYMRHNVSLDELIKRYGQDGILEAARDGIRQGYGNAVRVCMGRNELDKLASMPEEWTPLYTRSRISTEDVTSFLGSASVEDRIAAAEALGLTITAAKRAEWEAEASK